MKLKQSAFIVNAIKLKNQGIFLQNLKQGDVEIPYKLYMTTWEE
jgi:hypothetical protein